MGYRTERIFVLTAILVVGLALVLAVSRGILGAGGSDAQPLLWIMALALTLVASAGAVWIVEGGVSPGDRLSLGKLWILPVPLETLMPGLLTVGFVLFLLLFESGIAQVVVLALSAASFAAVYWGQAHGSNIKDPLFGLAQTSLNVAAHIGAFLMFSTIYGLKVSITLIPKPC